MTSDCRGLPRGAKPYRSRSYRGIDECIISTAQQARPNVIHISEPVRAQVIRSSVAVVMKPLSASWLETPSKKASCPFQRAFLPLVREADCQHAQEHHHRPEGVSGGLVRHLQETHRPREQERHLEVENDEQDRDQIEAHVELHPGVVEGVEAALVRRELLGVRRLRGDDGGQHGEEHAERACDREEDHDRQVLQQERVHRNPERGGVAGPSSRSRPAIQRG